MVAQLNVYGNTQKAVIESIKLKIAAQKKEIVECSKNVSNCFKEAYRQLNKLKDIIKDKVYYKPLNNGREKGLIKKKDKIIIITVQAKIIFLFLLFFTVFMCIFYKKDPISLEKVRKIGLTLMIFFAFIDRIPRFIWSFQSVSCMGKVVKCC